MFTQTIRNAKLQYIADGLVFDLAGISDENARKLVLPMLEQGAKINKTVDGRRITVTDETACFSFDA